MGSPYVGEIRMFAGNFAPLNWAFCNGALLSISENETLFNLIGTTYGGDGVNTFALPNLQSRTPIHMGTDSANNSYPLAALGGVENVTLATNQIPAHSHAANAVSAGGSVQSPANACLACRPALKLGTLQYGHGTTSPTNFVATSIGNAGGGQPHSNLQPYLAISFIISLFGIFPSQS